MNGSVVLVKRMKEERVVQPPGSVWELKNVLLYSVRARGRLLEPAISTFDVLQQIDVAHKFGCVCV